MFKKRGNSRGLLTSNLDDDFNADNLLQTREQIDAKFKEFMNVNKQSNADNMRKGDTNNINTNNVMTTSANIRLITNNAPSTTSIMTPKQSSARIEYKSVNNNTNSNHKHENLMTGDIIITSDNETKRNSTGNIHGNYYRKATFIKQSNASNKEFDEYANKLFKEFGISLSTLSQFQNSEDKERYILEHMRTTLNNELEEWEKKRKMSKLKNAKLDEDYEKNRIRWIKEKADIFEWLNVRTKYGDLKKKLRASLLNNVNNIENVSRIEEFFNILDSLKKSQDNIRISSTFRIDLDGVPRVNNTEILKDVLGSDQSIFKVTRKFKNRAQKESVLNNLLSAQSSSSSLLPTNNPKSARAMTINSGLIPKKSVVYTKDDNLVNEIKTATLLNEEEEAEIEKVIKESYFWNDESEKKFLAYRNDAKHRLFNDAKSSSWNEVGFSSMVHQSHMAEKNKKQRETLFQKYRDGQGLSEQDYKFLAETNTLLQSFVDKNYLQKTVKYLNPEIIESHEINIAENILHDYQKMRKQIREARSDYLSQTNEEKMKNVQRKHIGIERKLRILRGRTEQKRLKKKLINYLNKQEEKKKWRSLTPDDKNMTKKKKPDLLNKDGIIKPNIQSKERQFDMTERLSHDDDGSIKVYKSKFIDKKEMKQKYHPPSKIIISQEEANNRVDYLGLQTNILDAKVLRRKNDDPKLYKLNIHCSPKYKNMIEFAKFYSGGPKNTEEYFNGNYTYVSNDFKYPVTNEKLKAIKKIQALIRGRRARKQFKLIIDDFEKTRKMLMNKKNGEYVSNEVVLKHIRAQWKMNNEEHKPKVDNRKDIEKNRALKEHFEQLYQAMHNQNHNSSIELNKDESNKKSNTRKSQVGLTGIKGFLTAIAPKLDRYLSPEQTTKTKKIQNNLASTAITNLKMPKFEARQTEGNIASDIQANINQENEERRNSIEIMQNNDKKKTKSVSVSIVPRPKTALSTSNSSSTMGILKKSRKVSKDQLLRSATKETITTATEVAIDKEAAEDQRMERITKRAPPKGLLLKQRKLLAAARHNNLDMVLNNAFTYFDSDVNIKDDKGNTPLYYTTKNGNLKFCQFLVDRGARVNEFCENNNTPLHMAFASNQEMLIIMLISKGGNLNTLNEFGQTPLAFSSERVLDLLDLKGGVATYDKGGSDIFFLPKGMDNNKLVDNHDKGRSKADFGLIFEPNKIKSPGDPLTSNKKLSSFKPQSNATTPIMPLLIKDMSTAYTEEKV